MIFSSLSLYKNIKIFVVYYFLIFLIAYLPPKNILKKKSTIPKITVKYPCDTSWEVIKKSPAYFRRCGFMYEKIAENHDLDTLLHISLEEYPNKVIHIEIYF